MTSDMKKTIINTRERITSSKINKQVRIHDRNLQEALKVLLGADSEQSGVIGGFVVSVIPASMDVSVSKGIGLIIDPAMVDPDSTARWIESESGVISTAAAADPGNPRWDVVEILPGVTSTGSFARDIYNPALDTAVSTNVSIEETPTPVVQVRPGTPAAAPAFPTGIPGAIPLAYIYVPAGVGALPLDGVVMCRPMIRPSVSTSQDGAGAGVTQVEGGGIISDGSLGLDIKAMRGAFKGSSTGFYIDGVVPVDVAGNGNIDTSAAYTADASAYAYIAEPPYPSGYDVSVAKREFVPTGATAYSQFTCVNTGSYGAVVIYSHAAPADVFAFDSGATGGATGHINDAAWGGVTTSVKGSWLYVGHYQTAAGNFTREQSLSAKFKIYRKSLFPRRKLKTDGDGIQTIWSSSAASNLAFLPPTALAIDGWFEVEWTGPGVKVYQIKITDERNYTFEISETFSVATVGFDAKSYQHRAHPGPSGNVTFSVAASTMDEISWHSSSYDDSILGLR